MVEPLNNLFKFIKRAKIDKNIEKYEHYKETVSKHKKINYSLSNKFILQFVFTISLLVFLPLIISSSTLNITFFYLLSGIILPFMSIHFVNEINNKTSYKENSHSYVEKISDFFFSNKKHEITHYKMSMEHLYDKITYPDIKKKIFYYFESICNEKNTYNDLEIKFQQNKLKTILTNYQKNLDNNIQESCASLLEMMDISFKLLDMTKKYKDMSLEKQFKQKRSLLERFKKTEQQKEEQKLLFIRNKHDKNISSYEEIEKML